MHQKRDLILKCRDDVINGKKITDFNISELFNIDNELLLDLSDASNHITRHFHGSKVDIEELANIKKNFCSEDCTFCSQSAFFNTKITGYELPPPEEIVEQALSAKNDGAGSFVLLLHGENLVHMILKRYVQLLKRLIKKLEFQLNVVLDF